MRAAWDPVTPNSLIAFNKSLFTPIQPINGLRHPKEGNIDGWYLWSGGDIQDDIHFFEPIHVEHLITSKSLVLKYLALPAEWRFQIDEKGYEDIWFDPKILVID